MQEAITQSILPAYQQLVLEAPSMMERVAGEVLIQALWADCLRELDSTLWYDAPLTPPGKPAVAPRWKLPSPLHTMHCVNGHGGHLNGCCGGPWRGAEIPGTTACGQTAREKK